MNNICFLVDFATPLIQLVTIRTYLLTDYIEFDTSVHAPPAYSSGESSMFVNYGNEDVGFVLKLEKVQFVPDVDNLTLDALAINEQFEILIIKRVDNSVNN